MIRIIIVLQSLYWIRGVAGVNGVTQPPTFWAKTGESATIDCSHTKGSAYREMSWYRQYHGESMELIVYTTSYSEPDYGKFNQTKFSAIKTVPESGSFTVNDVDYSDSAVYFCANPPDLIKSHNEFAEIKCAHTVNSYDRILWYKHSQDSGFTLMGYIFAATLKPEAEFEAKIKLSGNGRNNGSLTINNLASASESVTDSRSDATDHCTLTHQLRAMIKLTTLVILLTGLTNGTVVQQSPHDLIKYQGQSAVIRCSHKIERYDRIMWYKETKKKDFIFMGYLISKNANPETEFKDKVTISGDAFDGYGSLEVLRLSLKSEGVYFCAAYYTAV
ncbi:T-cell receptor beta variable [Clarias magur]|nr:T-cell receptor beta variable [Clarias magur]